MADVLIGAMGRTVARDESYIRISGPAAELGAWTGRGGFPQAKIDRIIRRHEKNAGRESARITLEAIRRNIPRRSGRTAHTFGIEHIQLGPEQEWRVGSSDDNAIRLEDGTGVYGPRHKPIVPTHAKFLRFPMRGGGGFRLNDMPRMIHGQVHPNAQFIYARSVRGMRPRHYLEETAREVRPLVIRIHKNAAHLAAMEIRSR